MRWHCFVLSLVVAPVVAGPSLIPFKPGPIFPSNFLQKRDEVRTCSLQSAVLPQRGSAPELPDPSSGLTVKHVGLGRGTQNYTCATADNSSIPVAIGAVASLFDASCLIAPNSNLYDTFADRILQLSQAITTLFASMASQIFKTQMLLGIHYFPLPKTPLFDLRFNDDADWATAGVVANVPAPASATAPAVDWLKLTRKDGYGIQEVYRVKTLGGKPPATCQGQKASFQVDYVAQYWFFG